jgi:3-oxoacyl-[acyl-carrier protein] reductase
MARELTGRIALVTGANHGIGAAIAAALARDGADVFVTFFRMKASTADAGLNDGAYSRARARAAGSVIDECRAFGVRAASIEADLSDPSAPAGVFEAAENALGPIDILVNNASAWKADTFVPVQAREAQTWPLPDLMAAMTSESIDLHHAVNVRASALLITEFARRHLARGASWGRIVSVSTGGASGFPGEVSYGASKAALESFTRAAALELGPYGVTANIVTPGPTQTGWITPELSDVLVGQTPLRRVGTPEDVADVVAWLAGDGARWVTGQNITASGGHGL